MYERQGWWEVLVWPALVVVSLCFWLGVGFGVYWFGFRDSGGPRVVCVESARGPHGRTFDTGTAIVCEQQP